MSFITTSMLGLLPLPFMIDANNRATDEPHSPSALISLALPVLMRLASSLTSSEEARAESTLLVSKNHQIIYATPIIIWGSYTLANNCRKNSVSFDGRTSFCFSSDNLLEFLFDRVESVIGNLAFTFFIINNEQNTSLLSCGTFFIYIYVSFLPIHRLLQKMQQPHSLFVNPFSHSLNFCVFCNSSKSIGCFH